MTYEEAVAFWYTHVNYEQRSPRAADLRLERMRTLLQRLDNPQERLRIVHVAGSKGKGSTSALLASILRCAGHRTGLFTSPHLCRVEERIQVDGEPIAPTELAEILTVIRRAAQLDPEPPTFFEIATAAGFLHFLRRHVDAAVVEVGLGGRFDSTNVCMPLASLITSISLDHTEQLGDRLSLIAMEKAGIVKPGRPTISGASAPEARSVIEAICRERGSVLRQIGRDFHYRYEPAQVDSLANGNSRRRPRVRVQSLQRQWPPMEIGLFGEHQAANAAVAVCCVEELRLQGLRIPDDAIAAGLAAVQWPARLELLGRHPLVVLDCAHNVASAEALVATLRESFPPVRRLLIFAGSGDKDIRGMFEVLAPHFNDAFFCRYASSRRSVPPEQLGAVWRSVSDKPFYVYDQAGEAWDAARKAARPDDLICITGSVFLAGELRPVLVRHEEIRSPERKLQPAEQDASA
jgi:dihydrofolate synthase/folylpolyglutamate synthase